MYRRDFHGIAAGLLASAFLPHPQVPARVDSAHIRYLRAALDRLRAQSRSMGGGAVLDQALRLFGRARAMLDGSDYTEKAGRELLTVTSELGVEAGSAAYDLTNHELARRVYGEAQLLATSSGDTELQAHVTLRMAAQATHMTVLPAKGHAREGLRLAEMAGAVAGGPAGQVMASGGVPVTGIARPDVPLRELTLQSLPGTGRHPGHLKHSVEHRTVSSRNVWVTAAACPAVRDRPIPPSHGW